MTSLCKTQGDDGIDREILTLAWPAILEMVFHMFVWIVNTAAAFVGGQGLLFGFTLGVVLASRVFVAAPLLRIVI